MVNGRELVDRFGDVEFLHELWTKARSELPGRISVLRPLARGEQEANPGEIGERLHKLRGLISNFLTEGGAIPLLVRCEKVVEEKRIEELPPLWNEFEQRVKVEVERLDAWLGERGYSNPAL